MSALSFCDTHHLHIYLCSTSTPYAFFLFFNLLFAQKIFSFEHQFIVLFIVGVYRRTPKDAHQIPPAQTASNNSKQPLPTGTDTGRSSSARATKK